MEVKVSCPEPISDTLYIRINYSHVLYDISRCMLHYIFSFVRIISWKNHHYIRFYHPTYIRGWLDSRMFVTKYYVAYMEKNVKHNKIW